VRLWVDTAYGTKANAERMGYAKAIEDVGGQILADTCPANLRIPAKRTVTHGFKQAHYGRAMSGGGVVVTDVESAVKSAIAGRWVGDGR
jgi:predicted aconitase